MIQKRCPPYNKNTTIYLNAIHVTIRSSYQVLTQHGLHVNQRNISYNIYTRCKESLDRAYSRNKTVYNCDITWMLWEIWSVQFSIT